MKRLSRVPDSRYSLAAYQRQSGAATLFVTVILMALLLVIAAVSAKIGIFELKTASNTNRAKESLHSAQGALDRAVTLKYKDDTYTGDSGFSIGSTIASAAVSGSPVNSVAQFTGFGQSVDQTGKTVVSEKYGTVSILDAGEIPPLMSLGEFSPNGNFSIVTSPDGGGEGVPLTAWVDDLTNKDNGTWKTCNWDEYLYSGAANFGSSKTELGSDGFVYCEDCECSVSTKFLCARDAGGISGDCLDIVEPPPGADMKDPFEQLFGVSGDNWVEVRDAYASQISCDQFKALGASAGAEFPEGVPRIYWISEGCAVSGTKTFASYDHPVIVVVQGIVNLTGTVEFWGVLFSFADIGYDDSEGHPTESFTINLGGDVTIFGSVLVNSDVNSANGSFQIVYHDSILKNLTNGGAGYKYPVRFPGSWRDFE